MQRGKMTLSFDEQTLAAIAENAKAAGFFRPQEFARYLIARGLRLENDLGNDTRVVPVKLKNYSEIETYVDAKRLGDVSTFAAYAMEQTMTRYPLSEAQKAKTGKHTA